MGRKKTTPKRAARSRRRSPLPDHLNPAVEGTKEEEEEIAVEKVPPALEVPTQLMETDSSQSVAVKELARFLYISNTAKLSVIAKELNIPEGTIRSWHHRGSWKKWKNTVIRHANSEQVKAARRAMSRYAKKIDDGLNEIIKNADKSLVSSSLDPIDKEEKAIGIKLEAYRIKIALMKTLTAGSTGRAMSPDPKTLRFTGTEEETTQSSGVIPNNRLEALLNLVPKHNRAAAKFIMGLDIEEEVPHSVIEAIAAAIDKKEGSNGDDDEFSEFLSLRELAEDDGSDEILDDE